MARFLFVVYGASGHIHPTLPVARELRRRGHDVALMTSPKYAEVAARVGLEYLAPRRWDATLDRIKPEPPARSARQTLLRTREKLSTVFFHDAPLQAQDVRDALAERPADVVVSSDMVFGVSLVAEKDGLPWATHAAFLTCPLPSRDVPPWGMGIAPPRTPGERVRTRVLSRLVQHLTRPVSRQWDEIRAREGLPTRGLPLARYLMSPYLYTLPSSTLFDFPRTDLPPQVHYVGPCAWQDVDETEAWENPFTDGKPLVYCTAGTLYNELGFVRTAVAAATGQPFNLIATVGRNNDPAALGDLPGNVRVERYIPQHRLLPEVSAVLCTGGSGVVMGSLLAGKPLLVVPQMSDQPENALRCATAGVGESLNNARATPEAVRERLLALLDTPRYTEAAQRLSRSLQSIDGSASAANLLDKLVRTRQPVLRERAAWSI